ncbi:FtsK/SpoIIIE domain-containing protein (plasmid) [Staphylococcus xylosus]|uniref:FtsK/SpoIIIE domain-containing protein n=1 Tax=Staphylococcus xylosus TaxID=1288 RepID=UPI00374A7632
MKKSTKLKQTSFFLRFLMKITIILVIINCILVYIIKPLLISAVRFLFDSDWIYKLYVGSDTDLSFMPEPHTKDWGSQLEHVTKFIGYESMITLLIVLVVFIVSYIVVNIFRSHNGEINPHKNDREEKILKKGILEATDSTKEDLKKLSQKHEKNKTEMSIIQMIFSRKKKSSAKNEKKELSIKRAYIETFRKCKISITTKHDEGMPNPVKNYKVVFDNPSNISAQNQVFRTIKDFHNTLIQLTGVTFDQFTQPKNRGEYIFNGSIEQEYKPAKLAKFNKESNEKTEVDEEITPEIEEGNFPLSLLNDETEKIKRNEQKAEIESERLLEKIDSYLASENIQADIQDKYIGNAVIAFKYKIKYSSNSKAKNNIKTQLTELLGTDGVIVNKNANFIEISVKIENEDDRIPIDNKKILPLVMSESNDPTQTIFGVNVDRSVVTHALSETPHMIIAGFTGSGKSVGMNYILLAMSYKAKSSEIEFALLDPKAVELSIYDDHPFNIVKPITGAEDSITFMKYAIYIMEERFEEMKKYKLRKIDSYNEKMRELGKPIMKKLIIAIDEFALMMEKDSSIESSVNQITTAGRAAGIHIILATQRPSTDIITGNIKNNMPTRLAYKLSSKIDSRVTLGDDGEGAEALAGKGDSLLRWNGNNAFQRIQSGFLSDKEVKDIIDHLSNTMEKNPIVDYKAYVARKEAEEEDAKNEGNGSENDFFAAQTTLASTRQGFEDEKKQNAQSESSKVVSSGAYFEQKKNEQTEDENESDDNEDEQIEIETKVENKDDFEESTQSVDVVNSNDDNTTQKESEALDLAQKTMEEMKKRREQRRKQKEKNGEAL